MWELHQIEDMIEKRAVTNEAIEALRSRLHIFMDACKQLLTHSSNSIFREEVSILFIIKFVVSENLCVLDIEMFFY